MNKPIVIPDKLKNTVGVFLNKGDIKPSEAPLLLSLAAFQEMYIKDITVGLNEIDQRIIKILKDSIRLEFKKILIEVEDISFNENYNTLRYNKPTLRLVYNDIENDKIFERINSILIQENDIDYEKVLSLFLSKKIGIGLEIDLKNLKKVKDLSSIFNLIQQETKGVSVQRLIDAGEFIEGVRFFEVNPYEAYISKNKSITLMCICMNKNIESFILKHTINLARKELVYLYKGKDPTKGLNENGDIIIGIKMNKVYNMEYGQKAYINLE